VYTEVSGNFATRLQGVHGKGYINKAKQFNNVIQPHILNIPLDQVKT
jgi:hypothetical protein